jgi:hypothetical protein
MSVKAEVNLEIGKKREIEPDQEVIEKEGFFFLFLVEVIKKPKNKIKTEMTKNIN